MTQTGADLCNRFFILIINLVCKVDLEPVDDPILDILDIVDIFVLSPELQKIGIYHEHLLEYGTRRSEIGCRYLPKRFEFKHLDTKMPSKSVTYWV